MYIGKMCVIYKLSNKTANAGLIVKQTLRKHAIVIHLEL